MSDLVGRTVKLKKTEWERDFGAGLYKGVSYEVDDPEFMAEANALYAHVRIWTPSTIGTMEFSMGRTNIHIDSNGIVTKINQG